MGDVIQFPGFDERSWNEMEPEIRSGLVNAGTPLEITEWICGDIKKRYLAANVQYTLSVSATEQSRQDVMDAVNACVRIMHDATSRFLFQIIELEIELYFAKHAGEDRPGA